MGTTCAHVMKMLDGGHATCLIMAAELGAAEHCMSVSTPVAVFVISRKQTLIMPVHHSPHHHRRELSKHLRQQGWHGSASACGSASKLRCGDRSTLAWSLQTQYIWAGNNGTRMMQDMTVSNHHWGRVRVTQSHSNTHHVRLQTAPRACVNCCMQFVGSRGKCTGVA